MKKYILFLWIVGLVSYKTFAQNYQVLTFEIAREFEKKDIPLTNVKVFISQTINLKIKNNDGSTVSLSIPQYTPGYVIEIKEPEFNKGGYPYSLGVAFDVTPRSKLWFGSGDQKKGINASEIYEIVANEWQGNMGIIKHVNNKKEYIFSFDETSTDKPMLLIDAAALNFSK